MIELGITTRGEIKRFASQAEQARDGVLSYYKVVFERSGAIIAESDCFLSRAKARNQAISRLAEYLRHNLPIS